MLINVWETIKQVNMQERGVAGGVASLAYKERPSENLTSELRQQIRKAEGTSLMKMRV